MPRWLTLYNHWCNCCLLLSPYLLFPHWQRNRGDEYVEAVKALYWIRCLHCADIRVEAGEDDAAISTFLQNAGQDDVQESVHVKVGGQIFGPWPVLSIKGIKFILRTHFFKGYVFSWRPSNLHLLIYECMHLQLTNPFQLNVETHMLRNSLENLDRKRCKGHVM